MADDLNCRSLYRTDHVLKTGLLAQIRLRPETIHEDQGKNPLARFEKRKTNYLLIAVSAALAVLLFAGFVMAIRARDLAAVLIFLASLAVFAVLVLANIAANRRLASVNDANFINWDGETTELQRQNLDVEVRELAKLLKADDEQIADLFSAFIIAEDLALRQIQLEENLPLLRHVSIGRTPFDCIMIDRDMIVCIEVSFLVTPDLRQERIESMMKKISKAKKNLAEMKSRLQLRLMILLVTQLENEDEAKLHGMLASKRFADTPVDIDIRILDFEMLQRVYVSE